jgi:hypothetical protein
MPFLAIVTQSTAAIKKMPLSVHILPILPAEVLPNTTIHGANSKLNHFAE